MRSRRTWLYAALLAAVVFPKVSLAQSVTPAPAPATTQATPSTPPTPETAPAPVTSPGSPAPAPNLNAPAVPPANIPMTQPPRRLTLGQAVLIGLQNNPNVSIAQQQVVRARAVVSENRARLGPQVTATVTNIQMGPVSTVTFPTPTGSETIELGVPSDTRAELALTLPVDISGAIRAAVSAAEFNLLAQEFAFISTKQDVALAVEQAYIAALRNSSLTAVGQESVANAQEHLRITRVSFEAGTVPRFDVLRAEVSVTNFQQALAQAQNNLVQAMAALNLAMGIDVNQALILEQPPVAAVSPPPILEEQQAALQHRPELFQGQALVRAAERGIRIARAGLLPSLAISATSTYDAEPSTFGGESRSWNVATALSVPLFNSGFTQARVREARADVAIAQENLQLTENRVLFDVRQAYLNVLNALERMRSTQANVEVAREALRLANLRYQAGLAAFVEVTDATLALTQASSDDVNARYDYLQARAGLARAMGVPAEEVAKTVG